MPQIHSTLPHIYSVTVPEPPPGVNYLQLAIQQTICPSVLRLSTSINLKVVLLPVQNVKLLCDVSTVTPRPLVPDTLRKSSSLILNIFIEFVIYLYPKNISKYIIFTMFLFYRNSRVKQIIFSKYATKSENEDLNRYNL